MIRKALDQIQNKSLKSSIGIPSLLHHEFCKSELMNGIPISGVVATDAVPDDAKLSKLHDFPRTSSQLYCTGIRKHSNSSLPSRRHSVVWNSYII